MLAGQPDPFDLEDKNSELAFQAFSKGHPGLELVAQGWEGWVKARVPQYGIRGTAQDFDASGWVQESPLKKKGYTVGVDGLTESVRRDILRDAYKGRLDFVRDRAYMREWGHTNTPDRLHRIAKHLAGRIDNVAGQEAIADWTADLRWLKREFYHGVNSFDWPAATP